MKTLTQEEYDRNIDIHSAWIRVLEITEDVLGANIENFDFEVFGDIATIGYQSEVDGVFHFSSFDITDTDRGDVYWVLKGLFLKVKERTGVEIPTPLHSAADAMHYTRMTLAYYTEASQYLGVTPMGYRCKWGKERRTLC